jgi:hypothetical protein
MNNDFITQILARLFDSFKAKNPKIAAIIVTALLMIITGLENGLGSYLGISEIVESVIQWITYILLALQGSRTSNILAEGNK